MPHIIDPCEELNESQVRELAKVIHNHEKDRITNINFPNPALRRQYLHDCQASYNDAIALLDDKHYIPTTFAITSANNNNENDNNNDDNNDDDDDDDPGKIPHTIFEYVLYAISAGYQCILSVGIRRKYLDKLKAHKASLVERFQNLDRQPPPFREEAAMALLEELANSRNASIQYLRRHVSIVERAVSVLRRGPGGDTYDRIIQRAKARLAIRRSPDFEWPFERLSSTQKIQVVEEAINNYGEGGPVIQKLETIAATAGRAMMFFTVSLMLYDIYASKNKVYTTVYDAVGVLTSIKGGQVIESLAEKAGTSIVSAVSKMTESILGYIIPSPIIPTETAFAEVGLEIAAPALATSFSMGFVCLFTVGVGTYASIKFGELTGWLVDRFFETGGRHSASDAATVKGINDMNVHNFAGVVPDLHGLARQVKANNSRAKK